MAEDSFSFSGKAVILGKTTCFVNGTQEQHRSLCEFLKAHEGQEIEVTYQKV